MTTAGIICEYNPFHTGHLEHIGKTRNILGIDCGIVCAMSGNFVQRGECAVFPKHVRAASAVKCGADLVVELPLPYVLSSAERFAAGGVELLNSLGICTHLSFGSESGDVAGLRKVSEALLSGMLDGEIKKELKKGVSYPQARYNAAQQVLGGSAELLLSPNDILGVEYIKAIQSSGSKLVPLPITREGAAHNSISGASGTAVRGALKRGKDISSDVPSEALAQYKYAAGNGTGPVFIEELEQAMLSRLRSMSKADFERLPDVSEGLYMRIANFASEEPTVKDIIEKAKTKRYTMSRIRRIIMCACLNIDRELARCPVPYIRVLAMNRRGRELLREIKTQACLPVITKPADARLSELGTRMFNLEADATDFYVLGYTAPEKRRGGQEWTTSPYVEK